jgi:ubiquinone biosynthesis protein Coq4
MRWKIVHYFSVFCTNINRLVLKDRPHSYTQNSLQELPSHTVGHIVVKQLQVQGLTYQPKLLFHDAKHVLLNYSMHISDELKLNAFLLGNKSINPLGFIYLFVCCLIVPESLPSLKKAFRRGKSYRSLKKIAFSALISLPLAEARSNVLTKVSLKQH